MKKFTQLFTNFLPLLFAFCGLFGVSVNAWGAWTNGGGTITTTATLGGKSQYVVMSVDDETHTSYRAAEVISRSDVRSRNDNSAPAGQLYIRMKYSARIPAALEQKVKVQTSEDNSNWEDVSNKVTVSTSYTMYGPYNVSEKAKYVRIISTDGAKDKYFDKVYMTLASVVKQPSITSGSWTFTAADYAAENSYKDFTVDWSNVTSLSLSKEKNGSSDDRSQFSYEIFSNTKTLAKGNYGTATIRVKYKHDKVGTHSVKVNVGSYSITFTGTTNKITPYIVTTPTVDTITYGQTISNSQLGTGLVKADLINAAGTVVPGTWTIDENGQIVTTSGGSNATVHLTFTPTDGNTYNTIHTTQSMFVRSASMITWASAYSAEKPTIPVGKTIENAATTTSEATITYSTSNDKIIVIENKGTTFRAIAEGEATITASHGVTATHGSASISKTFKTTYKDIQVIVWTDRFDRLTTEMTSKNLLAQVWIENSSTGVRTYSAARTALLEYSVEDNTVVSIPNNSTTLTIHKKGNTTITASVEGDDQYEEASVTMPVKVREPSEGCDDPLILKEENNGSSDYLYRLFSDDTKKPALYTDEYAINVAQGRVPDKLSFGHKGAEYKVIGLSFWTYYSGTIKAQQKVNGQWIDVENSSVTPEKEKWNTKDGLQLDERATHIRFCRPQGGEGYHYVNNVEVTMKHFIRTATPTVDFGNTIKVNSTEYQDVVVKYSNVKDALQVVNPFTSDVTVQVVNPFTSDVTVSDEVIDVDSCGAFGSATLRISFSPTTATMIDDYIVVKDPVVGNSSALSIRVKADVQRAVQTITWNQATNISTIDQILLNGTTNGQEQGQMNSITYTVTNNDGVISVTDNVVTILKPGTVTITATQNGSKNYAAATSVEKNFTISAEPLTLVAPTAQGITYGQALSESELSGGSAKDSKGNDVGGTFAWQSPDAELNAGDNQTPTVVFTPSTNAAWYTNLTTTANINVAKADPAATVEDVSFAYGTKAEDVTLVGTGAGNWTWTDSRKGETLAVDTYEMDVHFAPTDDANYNAIDTKITLTVTKADPDATVNAVEITYGATASSVELSGTGLAGNWTWTDSRKNDVLAADSYTMDVHFVPKDGDNYKEKDATVSLTVNKATSVATPTAAAITAGQKVSASELTNSGTKGSWEWDEAVANTTPAAGTYQYTVHFTPDNANYTTLTTTVSLKVNAPVNEFTNATGNGDWSDEDNWTSVPAGENPNIIVSGDLEITGNITVGNLTIENTGSITVITGGTLTVKGTSEYREAGYGDVHVLNDGAIHMGRNADLQVRNFTLDAKLAGKNKDNVKVAAASGQVDSVSNLHVNGEAYFQMTFDPKGKISFGWYDFVVPFSVNISDGIFRAGDLENHLVSGVDFLVQEYSETKNANKQKAWSNFYGTLQPGRVYTITFNYDPTFDQNEFVFKKASSTTIGGPTEFATQYTAGSGDTDDYGWNGLGNGTLQHGYITGTYAKMQVYNHGENKYDMLTGKNPTFAVGTSFFVQVGEAEPTMTWNTTENYENHPLYAPKRESFEVEEFLLSLREEGQVDASDHIYVSASEEATEAYVIGHDLRKMGNPTEAKAAQMWATKNGKKLCDIELPLIANKAATDLSLFAPKAGSYRLAIDEAPEDATLYLTHNGNIIWDLTISPYLFDLSQGTTEGYGLRIEVKKTPAIMTGVEQSEFSDQSSVRKVVIDNKVYIVTPEGKMYDIVGKGIKF